MIQWQPLETAPRDREPILIWTGYSYELVYEVEQDGSGKPVWFNGDVIIDNPTHWMPLPSPPVDDTALLAGYQSTDGEPGNPEADALAEELRRRNIDF